MNAKEWMEHLRSPNAMNAVPNQAKDNEVPSRFSPERSSRGRSHQVSIFPAIPAGLSYNCFDPEKSCCAAFLLAWQEIIFSGRDKNEFLAGIAGTAGAENPTAWATPLANEQAGCGKLVILILTQEVGFALGDN